MVPLRFGKLLQSPSTLSDPPVSRQARYLDLHSHHGERHLHPRGARMAQSYLVADQVHAISLPLLVGRDVDFCNERYDFCTISPILEIIPLIALA